MLIVTNVLVTPASLLYLEHYVQYECNKCSVGDRITDDLTFSATLSRFRVTLTIGHSERTGSDGLSTLL